MKRWPFWWLMCLLSVANGLLFYEMTSAAMERGIPETDNQGALLLMPLLWFAAGIVLVLLNLATLVDGRHIPGDAEVDPLAAFRFAGLKGRGAVGRAAFLAFAAFLVLLALRFDYQERLLSAAYAITGGGLLALLYGWRSAVVRGRRGGW